jgi:hypothetical protein
MPRQVEWIHKIPEILDCLRGDPAQLLDRAAVEKLFAVSPRQAVRILQRMEAASVGGAKVMDKERMITRLMELQQDENVVFEYNRREQLHRKLEESRAEIRLRRIQIPAPAEVSLQGLPEEIQLEPGKLQIRFSSSVELLQNLMLLAQAISLDWDTFAASGRLPAAAKVGGTPASGLE